MSVIHKQQSHLPQRLSSVYHFDQISMQVRQCLVFDNLIFKLAFQTTFGILSIVF